MRRSTVLSLSLQLVFPALAIAILQIVENFRFSWFLFLTWFDLRNRMRIKERVKFDFFVVSIAFDSNTKA